MTSRHEQYLYQSLDSPATIVADQVSLKLSERSKDVKHQLAARCGRIDTFGDALESNAIGLRLYHQLDQVPERPPQPVEPPDRQHVARSQRTVHALESEALHLAARPCPR
jgi:hypothetical protein